MRSPFTARVAFAVFAALAALLMPRTSFAYSADARTVNASNFTIATHLFLNMGLTPAPTNTVLWFVADTANNGVPINPSSAADILGPDDVLLHVDRIDGSILGNQPGRFLRSSIPVGDQFATANIILYLWNVQGDTPIGQPGQTFGVFNIGVQPPSPVGNALWNITGPVFADQSGGRPLNRPPVADASATAPNVISADNVSATVVLDGTLSSDPDREPLVFAWFVNASPSPVSPLPTDPPGKATTTLAVGLHSITLVVNDGRAQSTNTIGVAVLTGGEAVNGLAAMVNAAGLIAKVRADLVKRLLAAADKLDTGQKSDGVRRLREFQHRVHKHESKGEIPSLLAQALIDEAQRIVNAVSLCEEVEELADRLLAMQVPAKLERQLLQKLDAACKALEGRRTAMAVQKLKEFQKLVGKAAGKHISTAAGQTLLAAAQAVIDATTVP